MKQITENEAKQLICGYPNKHSLLTCDNRFFIMGYYKCVESELSELWDRCSNLLNQPTGEKEKQTD